VFCRRIWEGAVPVQTDNGLYTCTLTGPFVRLGVCLCGKGGVWRTFRSWEKKCMDDVCKCAVCSGLVARDVWMRKQATKTFVHLRPLNYSFLVTKVNQTENNSDDILIDLFRIGIFRHVIQFPPPQSTQLLCLFIPRNNYYVYLFLGVLSYERHHAKTIKSSQRTIKSSSVIYGHPHFQ